MTKNLIFLLLLLVPVFTGCRQRPVAQGQPIIQSPQYAKGFGFFSYHNYPGIALFDPWNPQKIDQQLLFVPHTDSIRFIVDSMMVIRTPVKRIVALSATHISFIETLGALDNVIGVSRKKYIRNAKIRDGIATGTVQEVGESRQISREQLLMLQPDIIFVSPFKSDNNQLFKNMGFPVIPVAEYLEAHPLGRYEWLLLFGLSLGQQNPAKQLFASVADRYEQLTAMTDTISYRPTVFSSKPIQGIWYIPGGKSYKATLLQDAGADYLWKDDSHKGSITIDDEVVIDKALSADFWEMVVSNRPTYSLADLVMEDEIYQDFKSVKNGQVVVVNLQHKALYEEGVTEPEVLLADLITCFHPGLLPGYQKKYYQILPEK